MADTAWSSAQQVEYQVNRPRNILTPINEVAQKDHRTVVPLRDLLKQVDQPPQLIKLAMQVSDGDDRVVRTRRQDHPEGSETRYDEENLGRYRPEELNQPYEAASIFHVCIVGFFTI